MSIEEAGVNLKLCPVCRHVVKMYSTDRRYDHCGIEYIIKCKFCGVDMKGSGDNPFLEETPERDALERKWNNRDFK